MNGNRRFLLALAGVMLLASLWLLLAGCKACAGASSIAIALPTAGFVYSCLRMARFALQDIPSQPQKVAAELDRLLTPLVSAAGLWLIWLSVVRPPLCPACIVFWCAHYISLLLAPPQRRDLLLLVAAIGASALGLAVVRFDKTARAEFEVLLMTYMPRPEPVASWARPGSSIHPDIVLPPKTALVVWTNCLPCQKSVAGPALDAFLSEHPQARVWVFRNALPTLPKSLAKDYLIPPDFFFESLGIRAEDPPAYVLLDGHRIEALGPLSSYGR